MKRVLQSALLVLGLCQLAHADDALKAAIAGSQRSPANVQRDTARHPYETLSFFGIAPTMNVVELSPSGGWYTEILAPYLRERGQLTEAAYDPASSVGYYAKSTAKFRDKLAASPAVYDKVKVTVFEAPNKLDFAPKASADMVLTFRNVHNWVPMGDEVVKAVFKQVFDTLKPGGVFGVEDHRQPASKPHDPKAESGYVREDYVIKLAESVGFKLAAKSEINANPKDNADHPGGVWTLPPTYGLKDKDRAIYEAIGESDRFTLKFIKP